MSAHTINHQIINSPDGHPLYAVVPYDEFLKIIGDEGGRPDEEVVIPGEVVNLIILEGKTRIRAWREHLGFTQEEVAGRMGISRAGFAQMEAKGANVRPGTLKKMALALGVEWEQLRD